MFLVRLVAARLATAALATLLKQLLQVIFSVPLFYVAGYVLVREWSDKGETSLVVGINRVSAILVSHPR